MFLKFIPPQTEILAKFKRYGYDIPKLARMQATGRLSGHFSSTSVRIAMMAS